MSDEKKGYAPVKSSRTTEEQPEQLGYWADLRHRIREDRIQNKGRVANKKYQPAANLQLMTSDPRMRGNYPHNFKSPELSDLQTTGSPDGTFTPESVKIERVGKRTNTGQKSNPILSDSDYAYVNGLKAVWHNNFAVPLTDSWVGNNKPGFFRQVGRAIATIPVFLLSFPKSLIAWGELTLRTIASPLTMLHRYSVGLDMRPEDYGNAGANLTYKTSPSWEARAVMRKQFLLDATEEEILAFIGRLEQNPHAVHPTLINHRTMDTGVTDGFDISDSLELLKKDLADTVLTDAQRKNRLYSRLDGWMRANPKIMPDCPADLSNSKSRAKWLQVINAPLNILIKKPLDTAAHFLQNASILVFDSLSAVGALFRYGPKTAATKLSRLKNAAINLIPVSVVGGILIGVGLGVPSVGSGLADIFTASAGASLGADIAITFAALIAVGLTSWATQAIAGKLVELTTEKGDVQKMRSRNAQNKVVEDRTNDPLLKEIMKNVNRMESQLQVVYSKLKDDNDKQRILPDELKPVYTQYKDQCREHISNAKKATTLGQAPNIAKEFQQSLNLLRGVIEEFDKQEKAKKEVKPNPAQKEMQSMLDDSREPDIDRSYPFQGLSLHNQSTEDGGVVIEMQSISKRKNMDYSENPLSMDTDTGPARLSVITKEGGIQSFTPTGTASMQTSTAVGQPPSPTSAAGRDSPPASPASLSRRTSRSMDGRIPGGVVDSKETPLTPVTPDTEHSLTFGEQQQGKARKPVLPVGTASRFNFNTPASVPIVPKSTFAPTLEQVDENVPLSRSSMPSSMPTS